MPKPVHFDIFAEKPEKAIKFYESVFNWKFQKWEGPMEYWMISTGEEKEPGIDGGLGVKTPESSPMNTIGVKSVDEYVKKVEENGGTILTQKMPIPGIGWFATFKDPEGNAFGLMEDDPEAK